MRSHALIAAAVLAALGLAAGAAPVAPVAAGQVLKGEVLEVQDVPNYTYLRLKTKEGEVWAAVTSAPVVKGAQVTLVDTSVMENFESKALKRTFDRIIFASIGEPVANPTPEAGASIGNPHGGMPRPPTAPVGQISRASGPDGRTVAETVDGAASLKDKPVTIRGQVVKYSTGILGKNWIHLQDGSGSADRGTNDILVTTLEKADVGDVVDARGTVRTNVDLGSGYTYAVLVEDAKIRK